MSFGESDGPSRLDQRTARMALSWIFDAGDIRLTRALDIADPGSVLQATLRGDAGLGPQRRAQAVDVVALAELARRHQIRFLVPGDDEWPDLLADLAHCPPLHDRGGVPVGLWVRGPANLAALSAHAVAIVGARACSSYGEHVAADLAAGLAEQNVTVVSGGAYGIDIAAHRGALADGGATVAVLAGGVDVPYPRGNADVLQRLANEHVLVSEVPPGQTPTRVRFLARNRLIAALASGSVMVEAAARSGARNTLSWAQALGRQPMAVPGPVHSAASVGCHELIRTQAATLVTRAADVLELISPIGQHLDQPAQGQVRRLDALAPDLMGVFEVLPARGYRTAGEVAMACGLTIPASLAALGNLEERGLAMPHDGGWRAVPQTG